MEVKLSNNNNIDISVNPQSNIDLTVEPRATQTISINRGLVGPAGPAGPNTIGGYPISVSSVSNYDALMFNLGSWTNIPQTEISDGGNF